MASRGNQQGLYFGNSAQIDADWDYTRECLDEICIFGNGSDPCVSSDPPTPNWMKPDDSYWDSDESDYEEERQGTFRHQPIRIPATTTTATTAPAPETAPQASKPQKPCFDLNDPLRYCMETGLIGKDEYERWKIVKEPKPENPKASPIDFGPGYNSESGTDDEDVTPLPEVVYGRGYITQFPCMRVQPGGAWVQDPWFPNPDPTPNKQYTDPASNLHIMMRQFVVFESCGESNTVVDRLNYAFQLKLVWEQFRSNCNAPQHQSQTQPQPLQYFWQNKCLDIYEALQDLAATQAKCFNTGARNLIPDTPEFHTTPLETLENTFETIGRMSRCMAEDFNTPTIVNYVEEFIRALYVEMRFMQLVEANVEYLMDAACNAQTE